MVTEYTCDKGHLFIYPAKKTHTIGDRQSVVIAGLTMLGDILETHVCPYCESLDISEAPKPAEAKVQKVLVIDLISGDNPALNKALADGYEIVGRYAKQYTLELKQKPIEKDYVIEAQELATHDNSILEVNDQ